MTGCTITLKVYALVWIPDRSFLQWKKAQFRYLYPFQNIFYSSYFRFLKFPKYLKFWIHCVLCTIVSKDTLHFLWSVSPLFTVNYQHLKKSLPRASPLLEWGILSLGLQSSLKVTSLTAHNNLCCSYSLSYPYPLLDHKLQNRGVHIFVCFSVFP